MVDIVKEKKHVPMVDIGCRSHVSTMVDIKRATPFAARVSLLISFWELFWTRSTDKGSTRRGKTHTHTHTHLADRGFPAEELLYIPSVVNGYGSAVTALFIELPVHLL